MIDTKTRKPRVQTQDIVVAGLASDSRKVKPGYLFAALPGIQDDGRDYIYEAIENGAVAVLAPSGTTLPSNAGGVELIEDTNPRKRFAYMANRFFRGQPETTVAVTGTNGKTSTVQFVRQIWEQLNYNGASIGTLGVQSEQSDQLPKELTKYSLTTPDPVTMHKTLQKMKSVGIDHLALEASSHGLEQYRLDGISFKVGAFLNLSRDHMDYHGTMGAYFNAKARLFSDLLPVGSHAVINSDGDYGERMVEVCRGYKHNVITVGRGKGHDISLLEQTPTLTSQELVFTLFGEKHEITLPLPGSFQAVNALTALGIVLTDLPEKKYGKAVEALKNLHGVRGRLQNVGRHPDGAAIFVDYAHTPDALSNVLDGVRPHVEGELYVVFGCGGDRDAGKRPMMGEIATKKADKVIITDDNPRTENPKKIRDAIAEAAPEAENIGDRRKAIQLAVSQLKKGDVLVVAGKGHEQGQTIDNVVYPFDDATEVRNAIEQL